MQSHLNSSYVSISPSLSSKTEICAERRYNVSLLRLAEKQRQLGFYNDVTIRVAGRDIGANQLVLGCFSKYFHDLFTSKRQDWDRSDAVVTIDDLDADSVESVIDFIYSNSIKINHETVCDILSAADYMQIEEVKSYCFEFLIQSLCFENYQIIRDLGKYYKCRDVVDKANEYVKSNSETILKEREFLNITKDELIEFIQHRDIQKISDEAIFEKCVHWTNHDLEKRSKHFVDLFKQINLDKMDTEFLTDVISNESLVKQNLAAQEICINAMKSHLKPASSSKDKSFLVIGGETVCGNVRKIRTGRTAISSLKDIRTQRFNSASALFDRKVYLLGGQVRVGNATKATNKVEYLDMGESNIYGQFWQEAAPMKESRFVFGAAPLGRGILVAGGAKDSGEFLSGCEMFDSLINQWRSVSDMKEQRCGHTIVTYQGCVYALGGHNKTKTLATVEQFDPRVGSWSIVSSMLTPRRWLTAAATASTMYAIGGDRIGNKLSPLTTVEKFEERYNSWIEVEQMNEARRGCGACALGGTIYVVGGANMDRVHTTIESYIPSVNEWNIEMDLGAKTMYPCVVPLL